MAAMPKRRMTSRYRAEGCAVARLHLLHGRPGDAGGGGRDLLPAAGALSGHDGTGLALRFSWPILAMQTASASCGR